MSFGANIKVPGETRTCSVSHADCEFRSCLWVREDPGSFTQGRGYRYDGPARRALLCGRRHAHGCPTPTPPPDPEKVRCCRAPDFPAPRSGRWPSSQRCRTCGVLHRGRRLELARELPKAPAVRCAHKHVEEHDPEVYGQAKGWRCPTHGGPDLRVRGCGLRWESKPEPHQPGEEHAAFVARRHAEWLASIRTAP